MKRLLKLFSTESLVGELKQRQDVEASVYEAEETDFIYIDGPATMLVIREEETWIK